MEKFDHLVNRKGYGNRSEALRDLIRKTLLQETWEKNEQYVAGSILLFYDHRKRNLMEELTKAQHEMNAQVLATTHFHLDEVNCLELIVVKGKAMEIQKLSNKLSSLKGVSHSGLTVAPIEYL